MTAQQWIDELEAKANAAIRAKDQIERVVCGGSFAYTANPEAVLRLVAMLKILALIAVDGLGKTSQEKYKSPGDEYGYKVVSTKNEAIHSWIEHAYQQTEPTP